MAQKYGHRANEAPVEERPCLVCENIPRYSWTDYHGEGYCITCGTPYQLSAGQLREGETYPRINIKQEHIPLLKRYWNETKRGNGLGSFFVWRDYPDQLKNRVAFNEWCEVNAPKKTEVQNG